MKPRLDYDLNPFRIVNNPNKYIYGTRDPLRSPELLLQFSLYWILNLSMLDITNLSGSQSLNQNLFPKPFFYISLSFSLPLSPWNKAKKITFTGEKNMTPIPRWEGKKVEQKNESDENMPTDEGQIC